MRLFKRQIVRRCGNCWQTFRSEAEMIAHHPCPLVELEREIAYWNNAALAALVPSRQR